MKITEVLRKSIKESVKKTVKAIIWDLGDRRGLRQEWDQIDDDVVEEIYEKWEGIMEKYILELILDIKEEDIK